MPSAMPSALEGAVNMIPEHPFRLTKRAAMAVVRPETPLLVQLVVIRRCNLTCGYCTEYDDHSPPVPLEELYARIDHLAKLGTVIVTLTGGEPLIHPDLHKVVERVVSHGMICSSISNTYPITKRWISRLNDAGLSLLQVSVDNLEPNEVSQKSWSKIKKKLALLKEHAKFKINVNAVLGSSNVEQTRHLASEIREMGFYMTVGLMHGHDGQIDSGLIGDQLPQIYEEMRRGSNKSVFHHAGEGWEWKMLQGGTQSFQCRAGARYLYVDEFGKVQYCSARRGDLDVPLLDYTRADLKREFDTPKGCEAQCTLACVRRASSLDEWRSQTGTPNPARPVAAPQAIAS